MRFNSSRLIRTLSIGIILLLFVSESSGEAQKSEALSAASNILKALTANGDPASQPLLDQWSIYLKSVSTHSIDIHMEVLDSLRIEYQDLLGQFEQCVSDSGKEEKYNSSWVKELIAQFGIPYLSSNVDSVAVNIQLIMANSYECSCSPIMKDLVYKETQLYGAYRHFLNFFFDFYSSLSESDQKSLKTRKDAADNFIRLIDFASISKIIWPGGNPSSKLYEVEAIKADKAIYDYFKNAKIGCGIDGLKAFRDFKKAIGKTENSP